MRVRDIMTKNPLIIPRETSVEYAAAMMRDNNIGILPVGDRDDVAGVITDRDILIRVTAESRDPKHTPVQDVMSRDGAYCFEDEDVEDACLRMEEKHIRRLLVFDHRHDLVGILSLDDIAVRTSMRKIVGFTLSKVAKAA